MSVLDFVKQIAGKKIIVYADFIDPFCYIGVHTLRPLAEARGIELEWRGFELNPGTPPEGLPLVTAGNSDLRPGMWASVRGLAHSAGLEFPEPRWVPNTRRAHLLVELAPKPVVKNPLIERIYQAYLVSQKDIGELEVLIELAGAFGISAEAVRTALSDPKRAERLDTRREEAQRRGFLGLPGVYLQGEESFWSAAQRRLGANPFVGGYVNAKQLLEFMVKQNVSDIHLKANASPLIRVNGNLVVSDQPALLPAVVKELAYSVMSEGQIQRFEKDGELDFAYELDKVSRFRVNVYKQKNTLALSLRVIPLTLKTFEDLNLPSATLKKLCGLPSGLILVAGITGAGKTTTVNSMINYINEVSANNIITIEDPIEFFHKDKKSSISQREVGNDTQSFATALKYILRQDPDIIVIGEMRDPEAIAAAVTAAETGHLVLSTIHTMDAAQTLQRIVDTYPLSQQSQVRMSLSNILRGVIAQRLVPRADGTGRVPCTEILIATPYIRQLIADGKLPEISTAMGRGQNDGMVTFDQDLIRLTREGTITAEAAVADASRPENLMSMLQGISVKI